MHQQSGHLSDAQVEQYGNTVRPGRPEADDREIEAHLADCGVCRERVLAAQRIRFTLLAVPEMTSGPNARRPGSAKPAGIGPGPNCPDENNLRNLAAGLLPPDQASKLVQHAAQCDHCGPLLRSYVADFSDEASDEDQALLAKLKSSSADWQKKLVADLRASSGRSTAKSEKKSFPRRWVWAPAALAACAAIAFAVWYQQRETPEKVEKLLAEAYSEQRTMEMRWPGAQWGPVRVTRGPDDSRFAKPKALLKAEGIIGERQPANPTDIKWLQTKAEADILERNPEQAIAGLQRALELQPDSVPLMIDLGIAYNLQAEISDDPRNLEQALEALSKSLAKDPGNRAALFNRALLFERMGFIDSAISDWETLLKSETDQAWRDEEQKKVDFLLETKRKRASMVTPHSLSEWNDYLNSNDVNSSENALEAAWLEWLSNAKVSDHPDPAVDQTLATAARRLVSQHRDSWLVDLLRARSSPNFRPAMVALQTSVLLNSQGKASDAVRPARQAQSYFVRDHNLAGLARAQLEEVYSYQRSAQGSQCLAIARSSLRLIAEKSYPWIRIQLLLDEASCFNVIGRIEEAKLDADDAFALAKESGYRILFLRSLGICAALATTRGDGAFALKRDLEGIREYWLRRVPAMRGYQFFSDLSFGAESAELWHVAYAADREAVSLISQTGNRQVEAVGRYRLAKAAVMLGLEPIAKTQMLLAEQLLGSLPSTESTMVARLDGSIGIARSYASLGQYRLALDLIRQINIPPEFLESRLIARRLDQIRGEIELKQGNLPQAQDAYRAAVSIAESSLRTLKNPHERAMWNQENGPSYRALVDIFQRQSDPLAGLEVWEFYKATPVRTRMLARPEALDPPRPGRESSEMTFSGFLAQRQSPLRGQRVIVYAFLPAGLGIWYVDGTHHDFKIADLPPEEIRRLARQFAEECGNPESNLEALRQHGSRLYQILIAPVRRYLEPGSVLTLETDEELAKLPFAAIVDDSGNYLVDSFALRFSPGVIYGSSLRKPEPLRRTDRALVIGDPAIRGRWRRILPPLPSARIEAEAIATKFDHATVLTGSKASINQLERELYTANIFWFAGHSIEVGSGSALVLAAPQDAPDGADLFTMSPGSDALPHLRLVVLSACSTGKGQTSSGGAIAGAFLVAGVPQVIVSLWRVDSTASSDFMVEMFEKLDSGKPVPEALRLAATAVNKRVGWAHPYYWAAFLEIGRG